MPGKSELLQQLFCQELWDRGDSHSRPADFFIALEERLVRAIEDEQRVDVQGEEAQEAVVKGSEGRVGAAFSGLDLEEPDADVDGEAEGPVASAVVFSAQLCEGNALAGADVFEDAGGVG